MNGIAAVIERLRPGGRQAAAVLPAVVNDSPGWASLTGRPQDYDPARVYELYQDALTAWRIIAITTDYVIGDSLSISSPLRALQRFIGEFWRQSKNQLDLRLEPMCDELARAGDLFVLLFRNPQDGLSYMRFVTKDRIRRIVTAPNDWETELEYHEMAEDGGERVWLSPAHPASAEQAAVMLHYAVNRPVGALMGESDLTTMLPWLQRYSRMLEDRVRLHWAVRAFLWMVTVPTNKVLEKQEQYRTPPESGSIVVKDASEAWETVAPDLNSADAQHDLKAVRGMIDAGSGYPPHWRGEPADANLATAMQAPTERHLLRRQNYFKFMLQDILYQAYQRAVEIGLRRPLASRDYETLFQVSMPDISRTDNEALARAARDLADAFTQLKAAGSFSGRAFDRLALTMFLRFAGENVGGALVDEILDSG